MADDGQRIADGRVDTKTERAYKRKIVELRNFLAREDPGLVENDEIRLPLNPGLTVTFFGEIHKFPRLEEHAENENDVQENHDRRVAEERVKAVSTVEAYRSAIVC